VWCHWLPKQANIAGGIEVAFLLLAALRGSATNSERPCGVSSLLSYDSTEPNDCAVDAWTARTVNTVGTLKVCLLTVASGLVLAASLPTKPTAEAR
jgi:hypothetical protein